MPSTITITGTEANQYTVDATSLSPFSNVVVADSSPGQTETVTVALSAAGHGALSSIDNGNYDPATGVYTVTGTAAEATAALDNLIFTPTVADQPIKTIFALNVVDSAGHTASNHATTVTSAQPITIATNGVTTVASLGNQNNVNDTYMVESINGSVVAFLTLNGSPVTVNQFSARWTPVGAIQTGNGYEVAWVSTSETYVVWNVASNGAYTGNATGVLSATSTELAGIEANFGELGNDGLFPGPTPLSSGPTPAMPQTIATNAATTLALVGNLYELNPAGGGTGPLLELSGSVVTQGQFGAAGWTPVGAIQSGNGWEVAFSGTNGYAVWNVNSSGDFTGEATAVAPAGSATIEAVEANFGETFAGAGTPASPQTIATNATTTLALVGNLYELNPAGAGTGPLLELNGSVVTQGQFGAAGWTPVGTLETGDGYEVAFSGTNGYVVWNVNSSGDFTSAATAVVPADSPTIEAVEGNFGETFAGAGTPASPQTIATNGATTLAAVGNLYELNPVGRGTGPLLELNGSAVIQGQFGAAGWTPVGAVETATGYEVAFRGTNGYVVWSTDSNGDFTSDATGILSGTSYALEALELPGNFDEDLNGDGTIGPTTTLIGTNGALTQVANQFELNPAGMGPFLQLNGSVVTRGQFGAAGWTPVGAIQSGNGWEVAFSGTNGYVVWNVNSSGDFTSAATAVVPADSPTIEAVEGNFGETFAGAGTPASPQTIATNGATTLAAVGNLYELNPAGAGTGPLLELNGSVVTQGQFGAAGWTPVGTLETGDGYEVAFSGTNGYVVWNVNSSGDFTSAATAVVPADSPTIEAVEGNFGETFAGAGTPASPQTIATNATTTLALVGNLYELNPAGAGTGPLLELNGSVVTQGQFGAAGWTPVGAKQTGDGYEVAFSGANGQYVVWNTNAQGDYTSNTMGVAPAGSATIEAVEGNFGETFAGAGTSAPATPITINGTSNGELDTVGNLFELNPTGGGPLLELNGSAITAGELGSWTPIGAEETDAGYEVAWSQPNPLQPGQNQYTVWNTDSNGNYMSSALGVVSGPNFNLEDLDITDAFGENLNGAPSLSTLLVTNPSEANLSGQTQNATIILGANTASASGVGLDISSSTSSPTFNGTPFAITLNSSAHEIVEYGLAPSNGIETVSNFVLGQDELNIGLRGAPTSLQFTNMTVDGNHAVAIYSIADPSHGLVLLDLPTADTAALLSNPSNTTFLGGSTGQGHALIT